MLKIFHKSRAGARTNTRTEPRTKSKKETNTRTKTKTQVDEVPKKVSFLGKFRTKKKPVLANSFESSYLASPITQPFSQPSPITQLPDSYPQMPNSYPQSPNSPNVHNVPNTPNAPNTPASLIPTQNNPIPIRNNLQPKLKSKDVNRSPRRRRPHTSQSQTHSQTAQSQTQTQTQTQTTNPFDYFTPRTKPPTSPIPQLLNGEFEGDKCNEDNFDNWILQDLSSIAVVDEPQNYGSRDSPSMNSVNVKRFDSVTSLERSKKISSVKAQFIDTSRYSIFSSGPSSGPSRPSSRIRTKTGSTNSVLNHLETRNDLDTKNGLDTKNDRYSVLFADISHSTSRESLETVKKLDNFYDEYANVTSNVTLEASSSDSPTDTFNPLSNRGSRVDKSVYELDTFKEIQVKNYQSFDSRLKVVSPQLLSKGQLSDELLGKGLSDELLSNKIPNQNLTNPAELTPNNQVYRNEMLALVQSHSIMVNKKQEEINHLRLLLQQERKITSMLSSPKQPSPRTSNKSSPRTTPLANTGCFDDGKRSVRRRFIPMDIKVTNDSKPSNYLPYSKSSTQLLPPFDPIESFDHVKVDPVESFDHIEDSKIKSSTSMPNINLNQHVFVLKPFHFNTSPSLEPKPFESIPEETSITHESVHELPYFPSRIRSMIASSVGSSKHSSITSLASSAYFTALDDEDDDMYYEESTPTMKRDFSANETTVMSKRNYSNDSIYLNTSVMTSATTPDSLEFDFKA